MVCELCGVHESYRILSFRKKQALLEPLQVSFYSEALRPRLFKVRDQHANRFAKCLLTEGVRPTFAGLLCIGE